MIAPARRSHPVVLACALAAAACSDASIEEVQTSESALVEWRALDVSVGSHHACALRVSGEVWCWGANGGGEVGDGTTTTRPEPVAVRALPPAVRVFARHDQSCAILRDERVACWGADAEVAGDRSVPQLIPGVEGARELHLGGLTSCATTGRGVFCWGALPIVGRYHERVRVAEHVPSLDDAVEIAMGVGHGCARFDDGAVKCFGRNDRFQAGDRAARFLAEPTLVRSLRGPASAIAAGAMHTCAVVGAASYCWGAGGVGQLGLPFEDDAEPRRGLERARRGAFGRLEPSPVARLVAGGNTTCTMHATGASAALVTECWGEMAPFATSARPVEGLFVAPSARLAVASSFGCALAADSSVVCWGTRARGEQGDGQIGGANRYPRPVKSFSPP